MFIFPCLTLYSKLLSANFIGLASVSSLHFPFYAPDSFVSLKNLKVSLSFNIWSQSSAGSNKAFLKFYYVWLNICLLWKFLPNSCSLSEFVCLSAPRNAFSFFDSLCMWTTRKYSCDLLFASAKLLRLFDGLTIPLIYTWSYYLFKGSKF